MILIRKSLSLLLLLIAITSLAVSLRLFLFSVYTIPTASMQPAIMAGDRIIANKLIPGPRIFKNMRFVTTGQKPDYWRLDGVREIRRNDVLVFNFPTSKKNRMTVDLSTYYVKRCVAIPGDTLCIINGFYHVTGCGDTLGNYAMQRLVAQTPDEAFERVVYNCFPFGDRGWTIKNFGPLYVPAKGDRVEIDSANIDLYKHIIEYESQQKISTADGHIMLGDRRIDEYEFLTNYYFMAGDYVPDSRDSRYWGFLPEDHIVGLAYIVWRSKDLHNGKYRKERFLKRIS